MELDKEPDTKDLESFKLSLEEEETGDEETTQSVGNDNPDLGGKEEPQEEEAPQENSITSIIPRPKLIP